MTASALKDEDSTKITSFTPELKGALHDSILHYLNRNGFSKTLKRFQSEAQIQSDSWKTSSLHLEDIFSKYNSCNVDSNKNTSKKPVLGKDVGTEIEKVQPTNEETTTKKKKKKVTADGDNGTIKDQSEVVDKKRNEFSKNLGQISEDIKVDEQETKPKKKKKTKHDMDSSIDTINGFNIDDSTVKTKDKKKKRIEQVEPEPSTMNENELVTEVAQKEKKKKKKSSTDENETTQPDWSKKEKKISKKRKRLSSDENENENEIEKENHQKTETFKEENNKKEEINVHETSNQQLDGQTNGKLEKDGVKSMKKQRIATDEPKTVHAFQRVKIDQVEFAHEKLQDNSYWAKDGAEIGYGAKAQEVLGQVRGRDFRHEKTKKKRGSYRGGAIDLQSHSIKFNYSDEE